jgi:hypothetical protein
LTGNSDFGVALSSINRCEVYRFIPKPWNPEEFKAIIHIAAIQDGDLFEVR